MHLRFLFIELIMFLVILVYEICTHYYPWSLKKHLSKIMFLLTNQHLHNLSIFPLTLGLETTCLLTSHELLIPLDSHLKITHNLTTLEKTNINCNWKQYVIIITLSSPFFYNEVIVSLISWYIYALLSLDLLVIQF